MKLVLEKRGGEIIASIPEKGLSHVYQNTESLLKDISPIFNRLPNKLTPEEEDVKAEEDRIMQENIDQEEQMMEEELKTGRPKSGHNFAKKRSGMM